MSRAGVTLAVVWLGLAPAPGCTRALGVADDATPAGNSSTNSNGSSNSNSGWNTNNWNTNHWNTNHSNSNHWNNNTVTSACDLLDNDEDSYGLFATCLGLDCNDGQPGCHQAGQTCCHTGSMTCSEVVNCGLDCGWPSNLSCAQSCYENGTIQAQIRLEAIQGCARTTGCGNVPDCIAEACDAEVSSCFSSF